MSELGVAAISKSEEVARLQSVASASPSMAAEWRLAAVTLPLTTAVMWQGAPMASRFQAVVGLLLAAVSLLLEWVLAGLAKPSALE